MRTLKNYKSQILMGITFIFFIFLCSLFPYTGDDWAWGSSIGIERLQSLFNNYNGRWAGNIIVILLTRSNILRIITMSICLFGIIYIIYALSNKKRFSLFVLATLLILSVPKMMLRQSIVWTSGFTNYTIPIFLILIYYYILNKDCENNNQKLKIIKVSKTRKILYPCLLVLGFITALFVEHVTIYIIIINFLLIIYQVFKYKKIPSKYIVYLIGAILGAILMFSNTAYRTIANDQDTYRDVPTNGISSVIQKIKKNYQTIYQELIYNNLLLNIILVALLIAIVYKFINKNNNIKNKKKYLLSLLSFVPIGYIMYSILKLIYPSWKILLKYTNYFELGISILFFFSIIAIAILCIENKETLSKIVFYWLSIGILTLPLFIVQPIGSRCFFPMYCLFICIIIELYNYVIKEALDILLNKLFLMIIIVLGVYLTSIYAYIHKISQERINYVLEESKNGAETIEITNLPYGAFVWCANPTSDTIWETRFKLFYDIPESTKLINIDLKEWNKNH